MIFDRVLVGLDGSPEAYEALAQARRLLEPGGELVALTISEEAVAVHAGVAAPKLTADIRAEAEAVRQEAEARLAGLSGAGAELRRGRPVSALLAYARRMEATLLVVGSHGKRRVAGILLGSVATAMLHEAPCAVLVARASGDDFPRSVVVGTDGSEEAAAAVAVARSVAERAGAELRIVVAEGGKGLHLDGLAGLGAFERDQRSPVDALVAAAAGADLTVVGSRGLHGVAALGSISERVAHRAASSVLVVRAHPA